MFFCWDDSESGREIEFIIMLARCQNRSFNSLSHLISMVQCVLINGGLPAVKLDEESTPIHVT